MYGGGFVGGEPYKLAYRGLIMANTSGMKVMGADFLDAHGRHWDDAEYLFSAQRWANADHLYGMAAECGLKRLMLVFCMPFDTGKGRPDREADRKHADGIWDRYESYRAGHHRGACYGLPPGNPFDDWQTSQRYAPQNHFDRARVEPHRHGADLVRQLLKMASNEGLV